MAIALQGCSVCGQRFEVRFDFQVQTTVHGVRYYCSPACEATEADEPVRPEAGIAALREPTCAVCGHGFELRFAFQQVARGALVQYCCSMPCRERLIAPRRQPERRTVRIAVLNQKGGTGKTTTAVNLAAGLAEAGLETLILDLDAQGHVATSLGAHTNHGLQQFLVDGAPARQCTTQLRKRLYAIVGDSRQAQIDLWLAQQADGRDRLLARRMAEHDGRYDVVVMDCSPAMSLLNVNALVYADHVLIPVSCDYLSLLGVKQMLKTLEQVNRKHGGHVDILGIVPTMYDRRNRISDEAVKTLRGYFHNKVLPPIRANTTIKEAPQQQKSIFEYAPSSPGARDYRAMVDWVMDACSLTRTEGLPAPSPAPRPASESGAEA